MVFIDSVMFRTAPVGVVPERVIVGVSRARIVSLHLFISRKSFLASLGSIELTRRQDLN